MYLDKEIHEELAAITGTIGNVIDEIIFSHRQSHSQFRIRSILLVSTAYDYFLLEEEGRLSELFRKIYDQREQGYVPLITHVSSGTRALSLQKDNLFDLVVAFNPPTDMNIFSLAERVKQLGNDSLFVFLANNTPELDRIALMEGSRFIDRIFTWYGDGKIFLSIVNLMEDAFNQAYDTETYDVRSIIVLENSIQRYSSYLPVIYDVIWRHTEIILGEELTQEQRRMRVIRRPKVLVMNDIQETMEFYEQYKQHLLCVVFGPIDSAETKKDLIEGNLGKELVEGDIEKIHGIIDNDIPTIIISLGEDTWEEECAGQYVNISYDSPIFIPDFRKEIIKHVGKVDIVFQCSNGSDIFRARDLMSLNRALWTIPDDVLMRYAGDGDLSGWLRSRTEFELAKKFEQTIDEILQPTELRDALLKVLDNHKRKVHQGAIIRYSREAFESHVRFSRIGGGALGGKARGLAFMDKILSTYLTGDVFQKVNIYIPRTVVLCTDVFDTFIEENDLKQILAQDLSDDRIASIFMEADLPAIFVGDLRELVKGMQGPLAVRSSSLLEDALFQPFAGVYSSIMLPNVSRETDKRYQDLCNAIKFVYASTYFQKARNYIQTTPNRIEDEKMGIVIQEVVGRKHGKYFYNTISGVSKSYNFYPMGKCKPEEGVANIALGLGKTIVDGGISYRFTPIRPKIKPYSSTKEILNQSQMTFYAIDLSSKPNIAHREEDATLKNLSLAVAEKDGSLDFIASTYVGADDRLYPGINRDGPRVLDFSPILEFDYFPLAQILEKLLKISEVAIGSPVEIEFAVDLDPRQNFPAEFAFLQVRSMVAREDFVQVDVGKWNDDEIVCYCKNALGNGVRQDIYDIVYVKRETFKLAKTRAMVPQIRKINKTLLDIGTPYLLIGAGRWGSTDEWLGIPVVWSDIAGAGVIVETQVEERGIDPSEGSHFFHNMTSSRIGYLTMSRDPMDRMDWEWLETLELVEETEDVVHVRSPMPLEVRIDGRKKIGAILRGAT